MMEYTMSKCFACAETAVYAMNIYDVVENIKVTDLISMFLSLETLRSKLSSDKVCYECLRVLIKCYKLKMRAQKMNLAVPEKNRRRSTLNPNAPSFHLKPKRLASLPAMASSIDDNDTVSVNRISESSGDPTLVNLKAYYDGNQLPATDHDNYGHFRYNISSSSTFIDRDAQATVADSPSDGVSVMRGQEEETLKSNDYIRSYIDHERRDASFNRPRYFTTHMPNDKINELGAVESSTGWVSIMKEQEEEEAKESHDYIRNYINREFRSAAPTFYRYREDSATVESSFIAINFNN